MKREEFIKKWKQRAWNPENQKLYDKMESDLDELLKERAVEFGTHIYTDPLGEKWTKEEMEPIYDTFIKEQ